MKNSSTSAGQAAQHFAKNLLSSPKRKLAQIVTVEEKELEDLVCRFGCDSILVQSLPFALVGTNNARTATLSSNTFVD